MTKELFAAGMGLGLGVAAGAALGMAMSGPHKRKLKRAADKAMRAMGEMVEGLSDHMGM